MSCPTPGEAPAFTPEVAPGRGGQIHGAAQNTTALMAWRRHETELALHASGGVPGDPTGIAPDLTTSARRVVLRRMFELRRRHPMAFATRARRPGDYL